MPSSETKTCQNCKASFVVDAQDFDFYKKIEVPPPTWCPKCRNLRRMAWREYHHLYRGVCTLCAKPIITIHAPNGPFAVYCRECYHSDKWDSLSYGREYDFSRPFFSQYRELMEVVPRPAMTGSKLVDSDFTHASESLKNCYNVFWSYYSEDSQNCYALLMSRAAYDSYVADNSDHVYECVHSNRLYQTSFGYFSDDCLNAAFLYNVLGCSDCFGCVNLRKQKYCLFNEKLTKEEYQVRRKEWDLGSYQKLTEAQDKFRRLYLSLPHRPAHIISGENVTGDIIRDAKNCQACFSALDGTENCKYVYLGGLGLKDSMDVSGGGVSSQLLYEIFAVTTNCERNMFSAGHHECIDVWYSDWLANCSQIFGCISMKNKKHCILNKQYSKEEYQALLPKVKKHMDEMPYVDKKGRVHKFGEFFPIELSAYAYNETFAFPWYPKTKEEVLAEGWRWQDPPKREYQVTLLPESLPDHIRDVADSILEEIVGCAHSGNCNHECTTAFRLTPAELNFYREMDLALPRICPNCRLAERLKWRNGFDLYHRNCQCVGSKSQAPSTKFQISTNVEGSKLQTGYQNTTQHAHGDSPCPNEFETTFSPESPEIIYCTDCYRAEFI